MKKSFVSILLSIVMVVSVTGTAFADCELTETGIGLANESESQYGDDNTYSFKTGKYCYQSDDVAIKLPLSSKNEIVLSTLDCQDIGIGLPYEVNGEAIPEGKNAIAYGKSGDNNITAVQVLEDAESVGETIRFISTLKNKKAFESQSFSFRLADGYRIVSESTWSKIVKESVEEYGDYYILNEKNEIVNVMEAPKAYDANGIEIKATYKLKDSVLSVTFDSDNSYIFPVTTICTSHPRITKQFDLKKTAVKKVINRIEADIEDAENYTSNMGYYVVNAVTGTVLGGFGLAADAVTTWIIKPTHIKKLRARKTLYNNKYKNMSSTDKLRVKAVLRWQHHGSNDGTYVISSETLTIL